MKRAIEEAKLSVSDVPVGAVLEKDGVVLAIAHNRKEELNDVTAHAEILVIKEAQKKLNSFRLSGCTMYVTLEPCPMCTWAILQAGISTVYFGSYNTQYGAFGSVIDLSELANSKVKIFGGIMEEECDLLLKNFFSGIRSKKVDNQNRT